MKDFILISFIFSLPIELNFSEKFYVSLIIIRMKTLFLFCLYLTYVCIMRIFLIPIDYHNKVQKAIIKLIKIFDDNIKPIFKFSRKKSEKVIIYSDSKNPQKHTYISTFPSNKSLQTIEKPYKLTLIPACMVSFLFISFPFF